MAGEPTLPPCRSPREHAVSHFSKSKPLKPKVLPGCSVLAPERRPGQPQHVSPQSAPEPPPQPKGVTGQDRGEPREEARGAARCLFGARARLSGGGAGEVAVGTTGPTPHWGNSESATRGDSRGAKPRSRGRPYSPPAQTRRTRRRRYHGEPAGPRDYSPRQPPRRGVYCPLAARRSLAARARLREP